MYPHNGKHVVLVVDNREDIMLAWAFSTGVLIGGLAGWRITRAFYLAVFVKGIKLGIIKMDDTELDKLKKELYGGE